MSRILLALWLLSLELGASGCNKPTSEAKEQGHREKKEAPGHDTKPEGSAHRDEPEHEELPRHVRLKPEVIEAAGIKTHKVERQALLPTRKLSGEIMADPDRSARISSPVAGKLEEVKLREGAQVKKGDVVAVVRVPELGRIHGAQAAAAAKARAARSNAERLEDLSKKRLASEQAWLDARAEAEALSAEARALSGQLAAMGSGSGGTSAPFLLALRSPITGVVVGREAVVGQPVAADLVLGTVADLSEVWFLARVFEKDLALVHVGAPVEVQLNAYSEQHLTGKIDLMGQQIDPVARTVTARVRLLNPEGRLRLGLFGSALVSLPGQAQGESRLVVPRDAVTEIAGKSVVFVRQPDDDFELHPVVLGQSASGLVEVISGLREGEQVVHEGVFSLKSIVLKSTLAEED
ncbi:MAG: efflux RND transporter periplasmic adaptor subunit [Polyangiaceae bacterium]|jgi:cobalt-zinc-cadmium efflux system membrane fusion protein|nr:efflux RND transporter periplasmic adaptor subunit [Polyangiaceae bacterium]